MSEVGSRLLSTVPARPRTVLCVGVFVGGAELLVCVLCDVVVELVDVGGGWKKFGWVCVVDDCDVGCDEVWDDVGCDEVWDDVGGGALDELLLEDGCKIAPRSSGTVTVRWMPSRFSEIGRPPEMAFASAAGVGEGFGAPDAVPGNAKATAASKPSRTAAMPSRSRAAERGRVTRAPPRPLTSASPH